MEEQTRNAVVDAVLDVCGGWKFHKELEKEMVKELGGMHYRCSQMEKDEEGKLLRDKAKELKERIEEDHFTRKHEIIDDVVSTGEKDSGDYYLQKRLKDIGHEKAKEFKQMLENFQRGYVTNCDNVEMLDLLRDVVMMQKCKVEFGKEIDRLKVEKIDDMQNHADVMVAVDNNVEVDASGVNKKNISAGIMGKVPTVRDINHEIQYGDVIDERYGQSGKFRDHDVSNNAEHYVRNRIQGLSGHELASFQRFMGVLSAEAEKAIALSKPVAKQGYNTRGV